VKYSLFIWVGPGGKENSTWHFWRRKFMMAANAQHTWPLEKPPKTLRLGNKELVCRGTYYLLLITAITFDLLQL
jgi:hypothetical protein